MSGKWEAVKIKGDSNDGVWTLRWSTPLKSTDMDTGDSAEDTYLVLVHYIFLVSYRAYDTANILNREWLHPGNLSALPDPFDTVGYWHKDNFEEAKA